MDPDAGQTGSGSRPRLFRTLDGDALSVRTTPYGRVGTVYQSPQMEVVWVAKQDEEIDPDWFHQSTPDVLIVVQGQLRVEFARGAAETMTLSPGDVLTLPAGTPCRACRWPRDAAQATVFLAAYPPEPLAGSEP